MAIKKLQNNFTTPEQSKRLLELGVPADSADCYFFKDGNKYNGVPRPFFLFPRTYEYIEDFNAAYGDKIFPCWSVGRLIEIYEICTPYKIGQFDFTGTRIEQICKAFLFAKEMKSFDFSKLEEARNEQ